MTTADSARVRKTGTNGFTHAKAHGQNALDSERMVNAAVHVIPTQDLDSLTEALSGPSKANPAKPVFPMLSVEDQLFLREHATVKSYKKNHHVLEKGDDGGYFYLILEGYVEVYIENDSSRTLICRMGPSEFFGELSLLTGDPCTASVMTIEDSRLAVLHKRPFNECLMARSTLRLAIIRQLGRMVAELTEKLTMLPLQAYGRIRFYLYHLAQEIDGHLVIDGYWTHQHLAELTGCTRETVAKIMAELKRGGWVHYEKQRIVLLKRLPDRF
jgi:CRP/FNR family cyclic AMP-dependent transcriptional regulator